jgi:predicted nucleotidyltransferase
VIGSRRHGKRGENTPEGLFVQRLIEKVLAALNEAKVRYLVVGGLAVVLHGHLRTTMDLDLVIQLEAENLRKALKALAELGYQPVVPVPLESFADGATREGWKRDRNMVVFSVWHPDRPTFKIDIFNAEPFDFDEAYSRAVQVDLDNTHASVVALQDLIAMKEEAGRPQDLADLEALRESRDQEEA